MPVSVALGMFYMAGVLATALIFAVRIDQDPTSIPGGGWTAIAVMALLWPLLLVFLVLGMLLSLLS